MAHRPVKVGLQQLGTIRAARRRESAMGHLVPNLQLTYFLAACIIPPNALYSRRWVPSLSIAEILLLHSPFGRQWCRQQGCGKTSWHKCSRQGVVLKSVVFGPSELPFLICMPTSTPLTMSLQLGRLCKPAAEDWWWLVAQTRIAKWPCIRII